MAKSILRPFLAAGKYCPTTSHQAIAHRIYRALCSMRVYRSRLLSWGIRALTPTAEGIQFNVHTAVTAGQIQVAWDASTYRYTVRYQPTRGRERVQHHVSISALSDTIARLLARSCTLCAVLIPPQRPLTGCASHLIEEGR